MFKHSTIAVEVIKSFRKLTVSNESKGEKFQTGFYAIENDVGEMNSHN